MSTQAVTDSRAGYSLRSYQEEGVSRALAELFDHRTTLVSWPTGAGKTVLMAKIAEVFVRAGQRVLVLAHRQELIDQARDKISRWTGLPIGIEKASQKARRSGGIATRSWLLANQPVVVASIQSIGQAKRLASFPADEFGLVLVDEAHHAVAATWRRVLDHFADAKVLGVTATPDRTDDKALGQIFESVAHVYDLRQAIADGHLVPILQHEVQVHGLDYSKVRRTAGDLNQGDLEKVMIEERTVQAVANPIFELSGDRPTLTFATSVEHARLIADQFNRRAAAAGNLWKRAEWLSGESSRFDRADKLGAFARGGYQHLVGCALFTEGFDEPRVACVAIARPTSSRSLYTQMVGRGTRLCPEAGKRDVLVLDLVGNAGKHSLISAVDIFAGDMTPLEQAEAAELKAANPGMRADELADLARAKAAERAEFERRMELRRKIIAQTAHEARLVDPFGCLEIAAPKSGRPGTAAATDSQINLLRKLGFPVDGTGFDKAQAGRVINELMTRRRSNLASYKQCRTLGKYGVSAAKLTFNQASALIDRIAQNGWKKPADMTPPERIPGEEG